MIRRAALPLLAGVALYFALFGGEYSVFELRGIRGSTASESADLERLRAETDSLRARADSLENDPATLERLARERFGMIRDGEVLYRFTDGEEQEPSRERETPDGS